MARPVGAKCYIGSVEGQRVCHMAMATKNKGSDVEGRATRLVVLPEWQGAGVGLRFLNGICQMNMQGELVEGKRRTTIFHTSHPGLCQALRRMPQWRQISCTMLGENKLGSSQRLKKAGAVGGSSLNGNKPTGFGGHFRAVQGFRYYGEAGKK